VTRVAGIFWLASYPKSGNTWMRLFLSNLKSVREMPVDINSNHDNGIASARTWLDHLLAYDTLDLTPAEVDAVRPDCHAWASAEASHTAFHKIHDANVGPEPGTPLIRPDGCRGAVYILRNPLDVAASAANHWGTSLDKAIDRMNRCDAALLEGQSAAQSQVRLQVRQKLLDWSAHVLSWSDAPGLPVHVVRYEDLLADPVAQFGAVARFLQLPDDDASLRRAVEASRFEELSRQEEASGFRERSHQAERFFRKGRSGGWREELDATQVARLVAVHGAVMQRYGYLDAEGRPA